MTPAELQALCVPPETTIRQVIACIDKGGQGIALVTDTDRRLIGTITDGDVRRATLASINLEEPVNKLFAFKANSMYTTPVTAPAGTSVDELLRTMQEQVVHQIPLLDAEGRVVDLATWSALVPDRALDVQAIVMAGGFGNRLRPLTEELPKPMLEVGGRPLMERIIEQLQRTGIRRVHVATHFKPEKIVEHFGDGSDFGVELTYVNEDRPLGTAGALGLLPTPDQPLLVINGDILTQVDFGAMLAFHREHRAAITMAVRRLELQLAYGLVECEGATVKRIREKPQLHLLINAGIYLLEPAVFPFIPAGEHFNMTELITAVIGADLPVVSFPIHEYWLDIGQHEDYLRAQEDVR